MAVPSPPLPAPLPPLCWRAPEARLPDPRDTIPPPPRVTEWLAHVAAGRIGASPPVDPEVAARRDAMIRLFARRAGC